MLKIGRGKISKLALLKHWLKFALSMSLNITWIKKKTWDISLPVNSDDLWTYVSDYPEVSDTPFQLPLTFSLKEVDKLAFLPRAQRIRYLQLYSIKIYDVKNIYNEPDPYDVKFNVRAIQIHLTRWHNPSVIIVTVIGEQYSPANCATTKHDCEKIIHMNCIHVHFWRENHLLQN